MKTILISLYLIASVSCQIDFSERVRYLSIELLHHAQSEPFGHVVISPFGVWSLMTGIAVGAAGNSRTQLIRAFQLIEEPTTLIKLYKAVTGAVLEPKTTGVTLMSKNFMFLDEGFKILPDFRNTITNDFGATVENLNFNDYDAAMEKANAILNNTLDNIFERYSRGVSTVCMSSDISVPMPKMILTNVIIFKGYWTTPFNETDTTVEPFYDEEKNEIGKVNMMSLRARVAFSNIKEINSLILELPFGDAEKYSMLIILPYPKIKVSEVNRNLQFVSFPEMFAKLQHDIDTYGLDEISVKLPRFKIRTHVSLSEPLKAMGVVDIFKPFSANFQGMTNEQMYLRRIFHETVIEVTEKGTGASVATSADFTDRTLPPYYYANRPFLYFVMHKPTATIIFNGIYSKPSFY